jgi:hypothetical protein
VKLLICGSRDYDDYEFMRAILNDLRRRFPIESVIHGGAKGADTLGGVWAESVLLPVVVYRADWQTHGPSAGPIRNKRMLDEGKPDIVVAIINKPLDQSRGTKNMVTISQNAGLQVFVEGRVK